MNGSPYRAYAYGVKVNPVTLLADLDAAIDDMVARYSVTATSMAATDTLVKQTLDTAGVPTIQYPFYLCFGREMWKKGVQAISGESLALFAALLITKWTARGLTQAVLQSIRTDVFNVGAPLAP